MKSNTHLPPSRTAEQFVIRFPDGMRERIAELAKENGRSMNAEIIARLEKSFTSELSSEIEKNEIKIKMLEIIDSKNQTILDLVQQLVSSNKK